MTTDTALPLSRPIRVADLPAEGMDVTVETTPEEREALARDLKLPAVHAVTGTFHLSGTRSRVRVSGHVDATVSQICVVTLDPFESDLHEDVDVAFAAPSGPSAPQGEDPPDEIVDGTIDLGALTAEFLVLGLDPYPRKPGVDFAHEGGNERPKSPFAALGRLKGKE
jgi:uncharacterized metal-binding protein YceD (DUF177 family)